MVSPVTDPLLLQQLNAQAGQGPAPTPVDPMVAKQLDALAAQGSKRERMIDFTGLGPLNGPLNAMQGFQEQITRPLTFGLSDKAAALGSAVGGDLPFGQGYRQGLDRARAAGEAYSENHPVASPVATGIGTLAMAAPNRLMALPQTVGDFARQGAQLGAVSGFGSSNDTSLWDTIKGTLFGSGLGAAFGAATGATTKALFPTPSPSVSTMRDAGIPMTPGQAGGEATRRAERGMGSVFGMNTAVNEGLDKSFDAYHRTTLNKVLEPIGETLDKMTPSGTQAVAETASKIGAVYKRVSDLGNITVDPAMDFAAARVAVPQSMRDQFDEIIKQTVTGRLKGGELDGAAWRAARERLDDLAETYTARGNADQVFLGEGLEKAAEALRMVLARSHPTESAALANANAAWRDFRVPRRAASYIDAGKNAGIFSPEHLLQASKAVGGESAFSQGKAPLQDWALSGAQALGEAGRVPLSGLGNTGALGAMGTAYAAGGPVGAAAIPAAIGGARLAYTDPGQRALSYLIAGNRPQALQPVAQGLTRLSPAVAASMSQRYAPGLMEMLPQ